MLAKVLRDIGAAVYVWDIETDTLSWTPRPPRVLDVTPEEASSGALWATLIDSDALASPAGVILGSARRDEGGGVPFEIEYALRVPGRDGMRVVWVEDVGIWHGNEQGRPRLVRGLIRVITDRHETDQRLALSSRLDPTTGTLNRMRLLDVIDNAVADAKRFQTSCAFAVLNLENLTETSEIYGHDISDELIAGAAKRLRACMRNGDSLGRFSATSFGLVLANCDMADLAVAARRFLGAIHDEPIKTGAGPVGLRVSGAGVVAPRQARTREEILTRVSETLADLRLHNRGTFALYSPDYERDAQRRQHAALTEELMTALDAGRIVCAFQPVAETKSRAIVWHEALGRIRVSGGDLVSVCSHVLAAEKLGLIHLLDRRMLDLVLAQLTREPHQILALNVSAETTVDAEWRGRLEHFLAENPGAGERLIVEITETREIGDLEGALDFVAAMRGRGVRIAIDDFGSGHTSFRVLRTLGADLVKIDGSFITALDTSPDDRAFVRALVALSHDLGFKTVAEFVERPEVADLLTEIGVDYLQGDMIGTPGDIGL
jgi:diguanylate cyclase (GGDEF)-like protein